jgi:hypothetical protein
MPQRFPLIAVIFATAMFAAACGEDSPPAAPTPPPTTTPPPVTTPPPTPPSGPASLASVTLNPSSVASQGTPEGTVTLTAAAPAGNAVVALMSNNRDIAKVPENVTVPAGATTATFRVETSTVRTPSTVRIEATYAGVTRTTELTVQSPALAPLFSVSSPTRGADTCEITDGNGAVNCEFNATASTGFPARYLWTLRISSSQLSFTSPDEQSVVTPPTNCGFLGNGTNDDGKIRMDVTLQLEDRNGNKSDTLTRSVTVHHNSRCGF